MMVESVLESAQDYGTMAATLPQWKRDLLQRRAARSSLPPPPPPPPPPAPRAAPPAPPPPPPTRPLDDDEELRYGPGIVKRLKSRYLSLALRETPRRRASALRRAASLEHLLERAPPPPPTVAPRAPRPPPPPQHALPPRAVAARRDSIKRARSVDALSRLERLDSREEESRPAPAPRAPRPPRRPTPLLSDAERPPPDVVRAALRKFETAPSRRAAPAARVSGVLRGLAAASSRTPPPAPRSAAAATQTTPSLRARPPAPLSPRSSTPEPRTRTPSPAAADLSAIRATPPPPRSPPRSPRGALDEPLAKAVSRAALEGIALAGASVRYSFEFGRDDPGSHLPPLAAANPVLLGRARLSPSPRQVGVIRPMPAPPPRSPSPPLSAPASLAVAEPPKPRADRARSDEPRAVESAERSSASPERDASPPPPGIESMNGLGEARPRVEERSPAPARASPPPPGGGGALRARTGRPPPPPAATSVVFDFSGRKEVPDYIENDGLVLRAARKDRLKAGDPGVVRLRGADHATHRDRDDPDAASTGDSEDEEAERWVARGAGVAGEAGEAAPPSPCDVRFVNDNVLINGRSNLAQSNRDRLAKLKLQFDDSLTRTFEYPSESSLVEDTPAPPTTTSPPPPPLGSGSGALASYRPSKMHLAPAAFQLGITRAASPPPPAPHPEWSPEVEGAIEHATPCADADSRVWSDTHRTDLLF